MIHFSLDEENSVVRIHAIINTYKRPTDTWLKEDL
jgi:hypothetical protein